MRVVEILDSIQQDVHYTLRSIGREPAVFVALILTLTLGIGLNTTIMTAVDAILLRPPPFRNAGRLHEIWVRTPEGSLARLTGADMWERVRGLNRVVEEVGAYAPAQADDLKPDVLESIAAAIKEQRSAS